MCEFERRGGEVVCNLIYYYLVVIRVVLLITSRYLGVCVMRESVWEDLFQIIFQDTLKGVCECVSVCMSVYGQRLRVDGYIIGCA